MDSFFDEVLRLPSQVVLFEVQRRLAARFPGRYVLHTRAELFAHDRFVEEKQATLEVRTEVGSHSERWPDEDAETITTTLHHRWDVVTWEGLRFEVLTVSLHRASDLEISNFVVGDDEATVERFFHAVCRWCATTRGEVLVFEDGRFRRDELLFKQIQKTSFDDLVLTPELGDALRADVRRFVNSKALYSQFGVPWKRGLLLLGAPGNGKTHTVRALVRETKWPCVYVKSFRGRNSDVEQGITRVFSRARRAAPCVVVLEDLDCLASAENRSVLLNELDGFAQNEGLLIVATTNHPEKLDRSLLDRPSRFDRKFQFALPAPRERQRYLEKWRSGLEGALQFSDDVMAVLVDGTHGFTFAYLKELTFGSMMAFMETPTAGSMGEVVERVLVGLKGEMSSARKLLPPLPEAERKISLSM